MHYTGMAILDCAKRIYEELLELVHAWDAYERNECRDDIVSLYTACTVLCESCERAETGVGPSDIFKALGDLLLATLGPILERRGNHVFRKLAVFPDDGPDSEKATRCRHVLKNNFMLLISLQGQCRMEEPPVIHAGYPELYQSLLIT